MKNKTDSKVKVLGLVSGLGSMPFHIAKNAKQQGYKVYTIFLKDNVEASVKKYSDDYTVLKLGQFTKALNFFKKYKVKKATMAGLIKHISIFGGIVPDLQASKILFSLKDMKATTLLNAVITEAKKSAGINFINSSFFLKEFIAEKGPITKITPNKQHNKDILLAFNTAKKLSSLDIGLTTVVCNGAVVAVEAIEGTNKCIKRAGEIYKTFPKQKYDLVIAKVSRPKQNMRFDLPIIGLHTINTMLQSKIKVLAVEASKTLILEKEDVIKKANKHKLIIIGI